MAEYRGDMPFNKAKGPVHLKGVAWQQTPEGWTRHMLRVHEDKSPYWSKTFRLIDPDLPYCLGCLSINVTFVRASKQGQTTWACHDCAIGQFTILPAQQDA